MNDQIQILFALKTDAPIPTPNRTTRQGLPCSLSCSAFDVGRAVSRLGWSRETLGLPEPSWLWNRKSLAKFLQPNININWYLNVGGKILVKPAPGVSCSLEWGRWVGYCRVVVFGVRPRRGCEHRSQVPSVSLASTLIWDRLACFLRGWNTLEIHSVNKWDSSTEVIMALSTIYLRERGKLGVSKNVLTTHWA